MRTASPRLTLPSQLASPHTVASLTLPPLSFCVVVIIGAVVVVVVVVVVDIVVVVVVVVVG